MEITETEAFNRTERPILSTWKQFTLSFYWLTWNIQWTAIIFILMPLQVEAMVGSAIKGTALGIVTSLGALISLALPPLIGALSDRSPTRWGRRRPFMLWGSVMDGAALCFMALVPLWLPMPWSLVFYVLAVMLLQFGSSYATSPYAALIPDIVPASQLGVASGWMGLMTLLGNFLGNLIGGYALAPLGMLGTYLILLGLFLFGALVTIFGVREPAPPRVEPFLWSSFWHGLRQPLSNLNFRWVFLTRLLVIAGQWTVQAFLLYYFRDEFFTQTQDRYALFGLSASSAEEGVALFLISVLVGAIFSAWIGGSLSDKLGRKPMVYLSSGLMSLVAIIFTLGIANSFTAVLWLGLVFGLGYGAYTSVDWALACAVLPSQKDYAKDMGVWHIASMLPQVIFLPVAGLLVDRVGYPVVFGMACLFYVLGTVFVSRIRGVR
jgi:MFS family permease